MTRNEHVCDLAKCILAIHHKGFHVCAKVCGGISCSPLDAIPHRCSKCQARITVPPECKYLPEHAVTQ